ncbi:MAG: lysozyme inhibitor LprI family protein [Parvibaculum sp.]
MKFGAVLAVLLAALLHASPATAASFDCAKASSAREKTVCADPQLSKTDEEIAAAYAAARAALSPEGAEIMRKSQRSWLRFLGKACPEGDAVCLGPWFDDRAKFLAGAVTEKSGRTFLAADEWTFIAPETPARDAEDALPGENAMRYRRQMSFRIDAPVSEGDKAFNAAVEKNRDDLWNGFDGDTTMNVSFTLNEATPDFVSLDIFEWQYPLGAAHGYGAALHLNFRLDKARPLAAAGIFAKEGWQKPLADNALEELTLIFGEMGLFEGSEETIAEMVANPDYWVVTKEGLGVNFPVYSVGPYAGGDHTVTTSWDQLQPWLADDAVIGLTPD